MKYTFSIDENRGQTVRGPGQELKSFTDVDRVVASGKSEAVINSFVQMASIQESEQALIEAEAQWWPVQEELQAAEARLAITDVNDPQYLPVGDERTALTERKDQLTADRTKLETGAYTEQTLEDLVARQLSAGEFWPWLKSHRGVQGADVRPVSDMTSSLAKARAAKISLYDQLAPQSIQQAFSSNALGSAHTYNNEPENQRNLAAAVASGLDPVSYTCTDESQVKDQRPHTAAQLLQVLQDMEAHKAVVTANYHAKVSALEAAADVASITAVSWA